MDEIFFFQYHLKVNKEQWGKYPILERRYLIEKFLEQKEMEQKELEKQSRSKGK
jgi:hypothetical protein